MLRIALAAALISAEPMLAFAQDGSRLFDACATCHGVAGQGSGDVPAIAGQDAQAMTARLTAFRAGDAQATIMNRLMRGYSDAEIAALATYLAGLK